MTEVRIAMPAEKFDPAHPVTEIRPLLDVGLFEFGVKARPATPCVELAVGT